jgi:hypothetical protein
VVAALGQAQGEGLPQAATGAGHERDARLVGGHAGLLVLDGLEARLAARPQGAAM